VEERLKKRLIGATVLVSLVVIFVPMLLEQEPVVYPTIEESNIPPRPEGEFSSRVLPLESEALDALPEEASAQAEPEAQRPEAGVQPEQPVKPQSEPKPEAATAAAQPESSRLRVGLSAWVVQAGSFSNRQNADKVVKDLQGKKFAAFVEQTEIKGKILYRVLIGPEVDRKRAESTAEKLKPELERWKLTGKLRSYP
jgi:DedD protein